MKTILLIPLLLLSGCFFARVDWESERKSATVWTIGKHYTVDPNGFTSESQKVRFIYLPVEVSTE